MERRGNGVFFFPDVQQVRDPSIAGLTTLGNIQQQSTLQAIADKSGRILMVNSTPGTLGSIQPLFFYGPSSFRLDLNLVKRISISERMNLELRADSTGFTNTPQWTDPTDANLDINSTNFGRITAATGSRVVVVSLRLNF